MFQLICSLIVGFFDYGGYSERKFRGINDVVPPISVNKTDRGGGIVGECTLVNPWRGWKDRVNKKGEIKP
jgi:hypothetical protein